MAGFAAAPRLAPGICSRAMVRTPVDRVRDQVSYALARHGLRRAHVAFSAGPDSCALADACLQLLGPAAVVLLHVDHRAATSAAARAHATAWAAARGLELRVADVDVPAGASWEAQARQVRYPALAALAPGELVMTAHTASDQAETVLLRLVRGTSPTGLRGIARRYGPWLRPLLDVRRADTIAACDARGLAPWRDPMNDDVRFARVRLRRDVLPALATIAPDVEGALCRMAYLAAEHDRELAAAAVPVLAAAVRGEALLCRPLAAASPGLARWIIAGWLRGHADHATHHVDGVLGLAQARAHGTFGIDLPGLRVERVNDRLVRRRPGADPPPAAPLEDLHVSGPAGPYRVRRWQPGDRMRLPRLLGHSRKVAALFVDVRVPREVRASARVVEDAQGTIVWVEHLGAAIDAGVDVTVRSAPRHEPTP